MELFDVYGVSISSAGRTEMGGKRGGVGREMVVVLEQGFALTTSTIYPVLDSKQLVGYEVPGRFFF